MTVRNTGGSCRLDHRVQRWVRVCAKRLGAGVVLILRIQTSVGDAADLP